VESRAALDGEAASSARVCCKNCKSAAPANSASHRTYHRSEHPSMRRI